MNEPLLQVCACDACRRAAYRFPADPPQLGFVGAPIVVELRPPGSSGEPAGVGSPSPIPAPANPSTGVNPGRASRLAASPPETVHA